MGTEQFRPILYRASSGRSGSTSSVWRSLSRRGWIRCRRGGARPPGLLGGRGMWGVSPGVSLHRREQRHPALPREVGQDREYAQRSATNRYRTTPLRGLWNPPNSLDPTSTMEAPPRWRMWSSTMSSGSVCRSHRGRRRTWWNFSRVSDDVTLSETKGALGRAPFTAFRVTLSAPPPISDGWLVTRRGAEPLERRPSILDHWLEHGVGLLPRGEEERIGLTRPLELTELLVDPATLGVGG